MRTNSGVGKSSILLRFTDDSFATDQPATIGVDFKVKSIDVDGKKVKLTIWDTAGVCVCVCHHSCVQLTSSTIRGIHNAAAIYDSSNAVASIISLTKNHLYYIPVILGYQFLMIKTSFTRTRLARFR
jgi:small GTP-binding protein